MPSYSHSIGKRYLAKRGKQLSATHPEQGGRTGAILRAQFDRSGARFGGRQVGYQPVFQLMCKISFIPYLSVAWLTQFVKLLKQRVNFQRNAGINSDQFLEILQSYLQSTIVCINGSSYVQKDGISIGFSVCPVLCGIYILYPLTSSSLRKW